MASIDVRYKKYVSLMIWIISLLLVGYILGQLTKISVDVWYMTLNRSPLTPPNYTFGIAWSILYVMIAISGWLIWQSDCFPELNLIKRVYVSQLFLNWSWTPLFFTYHLTGLALMFISLIIICVAFLILKSYAKLKSTALLLTPYFIWLLFAAYLNFYIWQYN